MRKVHRSLGALVFVGLLATGCEAPLPKVEGWRQLSGREIASLTDARRAEHPEQPPPRVEVTGDFNGDGKPDRALLMVNQAGDRFAPYVFDGAGAAPVAVAGEEARDRLYRYSLAVMPEGSVYGFCDEGSLDTTNCEGLKSLRGAALIFFEVDNGGSIYGWDGSSYQGHKMPASGRRVGQAAPAEEHPLARHSVLVVQSPMERDATLPTFQKVETGGG